MVISEGNNALLRERRQRPRWTALEHRYHQRHRRRAMPGLKAIFRAETAAAAEAEVDAFEADWGSRCPEVAPAWRRA